MCCILGVVIREEGESDETSRLIVTNHVSVVDHSAIELIRPCVLVTPVLCFFFIVKLFRSIIANYLNHTSGAVRIEYNKARNKKL